MNTSEDPPNETNGNGTPVTGSITQDNKFDTYVFTGKAGETYSIAMNTTSGNLDPSLYLIGPAGDAVVQKGLLL